MAYEYLIMGYFGVEDDLRSIFGVDESILSNEVINSLPNLPAAEIELADRLSVELVSLTGLALTKAHLAALHLAAAKCLITVKINTLKLETDNKTSAQRFNNALNFTEEELLAKAKKYIAEVESNSAGSTVSLLDFFSPAIDEITG